MASSFHQQTGLQASAEENDRALCQRPATVESRGHICICSQTPSLVRSFILLLLHYSLNTLCGRHHAREVGGEKQKRPLPPSTARLISSKSHNTQFQELQGWEKQLQPKHTVSRSTRAHLLSSQSGAGKNIRLRTPRMASGGTLWGKVLSGRSTATQTKGQAPFFIATENQRRVFFSLSLSFISLLGATISSRILSPGQASGETL